MAYYQYDDSLLSENMVDKHHINHHVFSMYFYAVREVLQYKELDRYCKRHGLGTNSSIVEFLKAMEYARVQDRMYAESMYSTYMYPYNIDTLELQVDPNSVIGSFVQTLKSGDDMILFSVIYEHRIIKKKLTHHYEITWNL